MHSPSSYETTSNRQCITILLLTLQGVTEGVVQFYKSLITKEVAEKQYTNFLSVLHPPVLKNDYNLC